MRHVLPCLVLIGGISLGCARQPSPSERRAATPHMVTLLGCVERDGDKGGVVLRGHDVTGTTGTGIGQERGAVPSTTVMRGGDEDRNARPETTMEGRASTLTPRLEFDDEAALESRVGQRALVRGEFEPAGLEHAYDTIKVASIETVSPTCWQ